MSTGIAANEVCAVIVTFYPERPRLEQLVRALAVEHIVIVDNGSPGVGFEGLTGIRPGIVLKKLPANKGIAAAQNEGIAIADGLGVHYVLLLDQDSLPRPGMVPSLRRASERLTQSGRKVGCVAPRFIAPGGRELSRFARLGWFHLKITPCRDEESAVECDFLISSGSLIPLEVIRQVGGMEEGFFIDQVDTEWCLRARAQGYGIFGACGAILEHRLGEQVLRIWLGRWRQLFRHKPFRYYYIFRNTVLLVRRRYVSPKCMLFQLRWLATLFLVFGILRGNRWKELRMMVKGITDGLRGVTGKLELDES